jgi:hypothetical protein
MRKILAAFALAAIVSVCGAQSVSASEARAEKSPPVALAEKVKEVALTGEAAEKDRAVLSERAEKVSAAPREGHFCEALNRLKIFKFYVSRFSYLGRMKDEADERGLLSLADKAARRIRERANRLNMN